MESSSELRVCSYANCRIALAAAVFDRRHSYSAKPTMSKTGAKSAIAVKPMVSVVGSGTGFDLHDMVFCGGCRRHDLYS